MRPVLFALALLTPLPALGQSICIAPDPVTVDPCVVGVWEATSDMAERMQAILDRIPAEMRGQFDAQVDPWLGKNMFIAFNSDGFYATTHLSGNLNGRFMSDDVTVKFTMSMMTTPASGWMSFDGNRVSFCTNAETGVGTLTAEAAANFASPDTGPREAFISEVGPQLADSRMGPSPIAPETTYTCAGPTMQMKVALPEPIGAVTYDMQRLGAGRLSDSLRAVFATRFEF